LPTYDEVSGQLESLVGCDGEVEFSESLFDQENPESPVSVKCAIKIEDDAPRWQRAVSG
jgi:hypothetical protein